LVSEDTEAREDVEVDFGREAEETVGAVVVEVEGVEKEGVGVEEEEEEEENTEGDLEKACIWDARIPPWPPPDFAEAYMALTATATEPPIQGTWVSKHPFPSLDVRESTERRLGPGPPLIPPPSPSIEAAAAAAVEAVGVDFLGGDEEELVPVEEGGEWGGK
jgi:hypothetical protein